MVYRFGLHACVSVFKVSSSSQKKWNGTVLKLEVKCSSGTTHEQHCVLIKLHGGSNNDDEDNEDDDDNGDDNHDEVILSNYLN